MKTQVKLLITLKEEPEGTAVIQTAELTVLKDQIFMLTEQVEALTAKQNTQPRNVMCYWCRQPGHMQRYCPLTKVLRVWTI